MRAFQYRRKVNPAPHATGSTVRREAGRMNRTEEAFSAILDAHPRVALWRFEPVKLRLADATFYEPDFLVITEDGRVCFVEVKTRWGGKNHAGKAGWTEDSRVKVKVAAETFFEFDFYAAVAPSKRSLAWEFERLGARREEAVFG